MKMTLPILTLCILFNASLVWAQSDFVDNGLAVLTISPKVVTSDALQNSYISDYNGDGQITIMAYGDSITKGVGDGIAPGQDIQDSTDLSHPQGQAGYPLRLQTDLGLAILNYGLPGEAVGLGGVERFADTVQRVHPDIVVLMEGANDPFESLSAPSYFHDMQTMVNIARAVGAFPILLTIVPPCCNHAGSAPFIGSYNQQVRRMGILNSIPVGDVAHAYDNTCRISSCNLLNLPEGIHPNINGYDVISETAVSVLLKIDLFAPDGPAKLEQALNLTPGSIRTKPDPAPVTQ